MEELKKRAKELLETKTVDLVIGYEAGSAGKMKAAFITNPEDTDKLVFNENCHNNLAVYLHKHEVKHKEKVAIVAPVKVLKSILLLASENQLDEKRLVVLAISPEGKFKELNDFKSIEDYVSAYNFPLTDSEKALLAEIEKLTREERWEYWKSQFSKCIKCYACRAACTLCYCTRCTTDCNQPQWIPVASHDHGNLEWHIMRAMHLAGRCVNCGECARACPVDIPLNLLQYKLVDEIYSQFGGVAGLKADEQYSLSTYRVDDKETFIL